MIIIIAPHNKYCKDTDKLQQTDDTMVHMSECNYFKRKEVEYTMGLRQDG